MNKRTKAGAVVVATTASLLLINTPPVQDFINPDCAVHYYAYEAPGTNQFGPTNPDGFASVEEAKDRFDEKLDCDPLFAASIEYFIVHGVNFETEPARAEAQAFILDRELWDEKKEWIYDQIASYTLENKDVHYDTLAMIQGASPDVMPGLAKFDSPNILGQSFVLHLKNGEIRDLRTLCDLQPSVPEFPKVPPTDCVIDCTPEEPPCPYGEDENGNCKKNGDVSVNPPPGLLPAGPGEPEPERPGLPTNPAPVETPTPEQTSNSPAPGATPEPTPTPAPTASNAANNGTGGVIP